MQRRLIIAPILATVLPAFAGTAMAQHPAENAQDHPASGAHVAAAAGQADAARIEGCTRATGALIDKLDKGDAKAATADFDATMLANLSSEKLAEVWQQVGTQMGKLQGRGAAQNVMHEGMVIIMQPLHFANGDVNAQVACDGSGKIAGFFLRPAAPPPSSADGQ